MVAVPGPDPECAEPIRAHFKTEFVTFGVCHGLLVGRVVPIATPHCWQASSGTPFGNAIWYSGVRSF